MAWHYTIGDKLRSIRASGQIEPATALVPTGERPVVWFTTSPHWEETANKAWQDDQGVRVTLTRAQMHEAGGGLVRIGIAASSVPLRWSDFKRMRVASSAEVLRLERSARHVGSDPVSSWRWRFDAVPATEWLAVQRWDGARWVAETGGDAASSAG